MPITPTYPGVYIEEVPSGVHTITGVATSIGAFFGRTAKGPIDKAERCLNQSDFTRKFGGAHPDSDLAANVRQFFDNGGTDCYVVRLAHNATTADLTLRNLADTHSVLTVSAKHAGNWGNGIRLEIDYNTPNPDETFNLRVYYEDGGTVKESESFTALSMDPNSSRNAASFVTQSSKLINLAAATGFDITAQPVVAGFSQSRRPFDETSIDADINSLVHLGAPKDSYSKFEISVNGGSYISIDLREDPTWVPFSTGNSAAGVATELETRINTQLNAAVSGLSITCTEVNVHGNFYVFQIAAASGLQTSVHIRRASANDLAGPMMFGLDQGGIEPVRYSNYRPAPTASMLGGDISGITTDVNTLASQVQSAFNQITLSGENVNLGTDLETTGSGDQWYTDDLTPDVNDHNDGIREKLAILAKKVNADTKVKCKAEVWGYHLAFIPTSGTINSTIDVSTSGGDGVDLGSGGLDIIIPNVRQYSLGNTGTSNFQNGAGAIGQDDDGNPPDLADYMGDELLQTGFHALDSVDMFNLMMLPADSGVPEATYTQLIGPASIYCQKHRAFLIIDAPASWTNVDRPVATSIEVNSLRALVVKDHSAVFYPRVQFSDAGIKKYTGSSGMIAGLMSRIDSSRGVWKAAAGTEADLRGVLGLEVKLTDPENGVLNKLAVNCARVFPSGFVNWGARTLDGSDDIGSEWKYIPIRRLALFIEESLYRGTKWVVFEPNDEPLWAKIRMNVGAFMMRLFRQGAFQGSTPDKAFYVKCDAETTPQSDRDLGIVNIEVGFAPLKPAEFVIIKIQQIAGDLS